MRAREIKRMSVLFFLVAAIFFSGCIARYDPIALQYATSIKTESLAFMDKAVEPYGDHEQEADKLLLKFDEAYEYARNKLRDKISARQWKIMANPERNMLVGFLQRWKKEGKLNGTFITEAKKQVAKGFDMIIDLEKGKRR